MAERIERIYTVNLAGAYNYPKSIRARKALKMLREFVARHMKTAEVSVSGALNCAIWRNGMKKPPRRVRVKAIREGEKADALLFGEEEEKKRAEERKEEKKRKAQERRAKRSEAKKTGGEKKEGTKEKAHAVEIKT